MAHLVLEGSRFLVYAHNRLLSFHQGTKITVGLNPFELILVKEVKHIWQLSPLCFQEQAYCAMGYLAIFL